MNYAEDRLDRRARTAAAPTRLDAETSSTSEELEHDLNHAQSCIRRICRHIFTKDCIHEGRSKDLKELMAAHRLAGRTLRDGGLNRQAVFHFGIAWTICRMLDGINQIDEHKNSFCQEWEVVGDYAQMTEFAGFPEVGVIALLLYRAGGFDTLYSTREINIGDGDGDDNAQGCGCGMSKCGRSPCYIAFPTSLDLVDHILNAFDDISNAFKRYHKSKNDTETPSALDILNQLAIMSGKSHCGISCEDRLLRMTQFMNDKKGTLKVSTILQLWNESDPNQQSAHPNMMRPMNSVLRLLLLKLLYSSPIASPFLQLACLSIPYISAILPTSSAEGRHLATMYKSHWAYYIFIRSLVLGERVKRKPGSVIHTPIWDVIFRDNRQLTNVCFVVEETMTEFSCYMKELFTLLSTQSTVPSIKPFGLSHKPIYVLGDSHVLSLAWQSICITPASTHCNDYRTCVPFPSTGIKAWHFRKATKFFTHYNLHVSLERLKCVSSCNGIKCTIILSAGEIDCREGIGGSLLHGYYNDCNDAVENTVLQYLASVAFIAERYHLRVLLMPVAPHAYRSEKNGKALGRAKRRETMHLWNEILRRELCKDHSKREYPNVFLLDYEEQLRVDDPQSPVGYVLKPSFNADYTHVNSALARLLENSLHDCGCSIY